MIFFPWFTGLSVLQRGPGSGFAEADRTACDQTLAFLRARHIQLTRRIEASWGFAWLVALETGAIKKDIKPGVQRVSSHALKRSRPVCSGGKPDLEANLSRLLKA
jgi:hypothetical protein